MGEEVGEEQFQNENQEDKGILLALQTRCYHNNMKKKKKTTSKKTQPDLSITENLGEYFHEI